MYNKNTLEDRCATCNKKKDKDGYKNCPYCRYRQNKEATKHNHRIRNIVYTYYSDGTNVCACCGETNIKFLTLDHINNDGAKDRSVTGIQGGTSFYRHLIKKNFPPGYQILCMNCNFGKIRNAGICPHKEIITKTFSTPPPYTKKRPGRKLGMNLKKGFSIWKKIGGWEVYSESPRKYVGKYKTKLDAAKRAIEITKLRIPERVDIVWEELLDWATIATGKSD